MANSEKQIATNELTSFRSEEMDWIESNSTELRRYRGEWLVVEKSELVAHNSDYMSAANEAMAKGVKIPFMFFVPLDDKPFVGV